MLFRISMYLWKIVRIAGKNKSLFQKILVTYTALYLARFIDLIRKYGFRKVIRFLYTGYSIFVNIIIGVFVLSFTEINWGGINENTLEVIVQAIMILLPMIVVNLLVEYFSDYFLIIANKIQDFILKIIDWAVNRDIPKIPKKKQPQFDPMDQFYTRPGTSPIGEYQYSNIDNNNKKYVIALLLVISLGTMVYVVYPDFYSNCFVWIKNKFTQPKDPKDPSLPGSSGFSKSAKDSFNTFVDNNVKPKSTAFFENRYSLKKPNPSSWFDKGKNYPDAKLTLFSDNNYLYFNTENPMERLSYRVTNVLTNASLKAEERRIILNKMLNHINNYYIDKKDNVEAMRVFNDVVRSTMESISINTSEPLKPLVNPGLSFLKDGKGLRSLFSTNPNTPVSSPPSGPSISPINSPVNSPGNITPDAFLTPRAPSVSLPSDNSYISDRTVKYMDKLLEQLNKNKR